MSNISVTTNQSVIEVTEVNGITVTTPEGQTISVTVPNSTVDVTTTTDDITVLTAGTLNINTGDAVTSVNGISGPTVVLDTDDIDEGSTNLYYTTARANSDFDTRLATKTTTNLAEGTNLYYTDARFDTRLATKTSDNLNEGTTNLYFTDTRSRASIQVIDSGGDGSLSYNNTTGDITYTGPSASEVRAHFTAGTGVTITSGEIAIGQPVATTDNVTFNDVTVNGTLNSNDVTSTGALSITTTSNGNISLAPNGIGNLTTTANIVKGNIRNAPTEAAGNIFTFSASGTGGPTRGLSIDNSVSSSQRPGIVLRAYGGSLGGGNPIASYISETARGSAATPTGLASGNSLAGFFASGYADTSVGGSNPGWVSDTIGTVPASWGFATTEAWTSGTSNLGSGFNVRTNPTSSGNAVQTSLTLNPQASILRSDSFTFQQGKTGTTQTMALDVNGNLTTAGDIIVGGNDIKNSLGAPAFSMTSDNTSATITSDNVILTKGSGTGGSILSITSTTSENLLQVGDVNIMQAGSTWQSVYAPGFKYTGLMSDSTQTGTGSYFEMSSRWKANAGTSTYTPPQNTWGLGRFGFSADNSTTGTSQVNSGAIQVKATENWTSSATGSSMTFFANKAGVLDSPVEVLDMSPENTYLNSDNFIFTDLNNDINLTIDSSGNVVFAGDLQVNGNDIKASDGATAITLRPITGFNPNTDFTGNIVRGAIRTGGGESSGDIWQFTGGSGASTGISIDNTDKVADRTAMVLRNYGGSVPGAAPRNNIIFEAARGSAASPLNLNNGNVIGEITANGYTSTGWVSDQVASVPGIIRLYATEAWNNGLNNVGTGLRVFLQPTATTLTAGGASLVVALEVTPTATTMTKLTNVVETRAASSSDFARTNFVTARWNGTQYTPTQQDDSLGSFKYNGNSQTGSTYGVPSGPGAEIVAKATENWTSTANGTRIDFFAIKTGTLNNYNVISATPDLLSLNASQINLNTYDGSTSIKGGNINYRRTYGCFHKVADITALAADTVYEFDWYNDTTAHVGNQGVTVTSGNPTRINIDAAGSYEVFVEMHGVNVDNQDRPAYIWLAKNGTDLAETCIKLVLTKDTETMLVKEWLVDNISANDYLEVRFAVDNISGISLDYIAAQTSPYARPAVPSATITITPVGA